MKAVMHQKLLAVLVVFILGPLIASGESVAQVPESFNGRYWIEETRGASLYFDVTSAGIKYAGAPMHKKSNFSAFIIPDPPRTIDPELQDIIDTVRSLEIELQSEPEQGRVFVASGPRHGSEVLSKAVPGTEIFAIFTGSDIFTFEGSYVHIIIRGPKPERSRHINQREHRYIKIGRVTDPHGRQVVTYRNYSDVRRTK